MSVLERAKRHFENWYYQAPTQPATQPASPVPDTISPENIEQLCTNIAQYAIAHGSKTHHRKYQRMSESTWDMLNEPHEVTITYRAKQGSIQARLAQNSYHSELWPNLRFHASTRKENHEHLEVLIDERPLLVASRTIRNVEWHYDRGYTVRQESPTPWAVSTSPQQTLFSLFSQKPTPDTTPQPRS